MRKIPPQKAIGFVKNSVQMLIYVYVNSAFFFVFASPFIFFRRYFREFVISILAACLFACTTTQAPPTKPSYQEQESAALAVLANYTGDVLAAAAIPLQYYCQHRTWPAPQSLDITQAIVSNLSGLYYLPLPPDVYQANFGLIDHTTGTLSHWEILIPTVNAAAKGVQKVKLELINDELKVHLLNVMDFECRK